MADSLFEGLLGSAFNYLGATQLFPEVGEFLTMESNLKKINLQLGKAITGVDKFGNQTSKAFTKTNISIIEGDKVLGSFLFKVDTLQSSIYTNAMTLGLSTSKMVDMTEATVNYGKVLSRETLGALTIFSEITGQNAESLGNFTAKLLSSRRIEDSQTKHLITNILAYREQYGLANEDIDELLNITNKYADVVGATGDRVVESTGKMAKFISVIKQTGLEASFATNLIDKIIDPMRMQDNMLLLSKLGFSMEELNFGDPMSNIEGSIPRLKELAQEITSIPSRMAAANIAEMYGLTLEEVRKLAEMDTSQREVNRQKSLTEYRRERQTAVEYFTMVKDSFLGIMAWSFNKVSNIFTPITDMFGLKAVIPIGFVAIKTLAKFFKTAFGKKLEEIAIGFSNIIAKALNPAIIAGGSYEERASLVGNRKKEYRDSSGLTEGLVESESRRQEINNIYKGYIERAGETNKDVFAKREEFLKELTGGKEMTFFEKERTKRDIFTASKEKSMGKDGWKDTIAQAFESQERNINELERRQAEVEKLRTTGRISEKTAGLMSASITNQIDDAKNNFDSYKKSAVGQKFLQGVFEKETSRLERHKAEKQAIDKNVSTLNDRLDIALENGDYVQAESIRRFLDLETQRQASSENTITSLEGNIQGLYSWVEIRKIKGLEVNKKEIELLRAQEVEIIERGNLSDEEKATHQKQIDMYDNKINTIEKEIDEAEAKREAFFSGKGTEDLTDTSYAKEANGVRKQGEKFLEKSFKNSRKQFKNIAVGASPSSGFIKSLGAKMSIGATTPFASAARGFATGGIRAGASGFLMGLGPVGLGIMAGVAGISAGIGIMTKLASRSSKTQEAMSRLEKSKEDLLNKIGDGLSNFVIPGINAMTKVVDFIAGDKNSSESKTSLEDYALAEFTTASTANGELLTVMKRVDKKMASVVSISQESSMFNEIVARSSVKGNG